MTQDIKKQETKKETQIKQNLRYQRDKDRENVKGIFKYYEVPGGSMSFVYKKYKEDPIERYDMIDGQIYTIPLGVAKHLNTNGWYPEYEYMEGEGMHKISGNFGNKVMQIHKKKRRFGFQSLEFVDIEELSQPKEVELVSVTPII